MKYSIAGLILASLAVASVAQAAVEVQYDASAAEVAGTACSSRSSRVVDVGRGMLRLVGSPIALELADRWDGSLARETCLIRVPARIPAGYYISDIVGYYSVYSDTDRPGAATVVIQPHVDGYEIDSLEQKLRAGAITTRLKAEQDLSESAADLCDGTAHEMTIGANVVLTGRRASRSDNVYVALTDGDLRNRGTEIVRVNLARCWH